MFTKKESDDYFFLSDDSCFTYINVYKELCNYNFHLSMNSNFSDKSSAIISIIYICANFYIFTNLFSLPIRFSSTSQTSM